MEAHQRGRQPEQDQDQNLRPTHLQPRFPNPSFAFQTPNPHPYHYSPGFPHQPWQQQHQNPGFYGGYQPPFPSLFRPDVGLVDSAARKAWADLWAGGESVSAWRVSQAALVALNVDTWGLLGFQMQQVPSLRSLALVEGKINAYIHCFVAAQSIATLHDLEVEICKEEGVAVFRDLGLGPLFRHPLVLYYFSLPSDFTEIFNITTTQTVQLLREFLNTIQHKEIRVDEFIDFVANARKVAEKSKLGILIRDFGALVTIMQKACNLEASVLRNVEEAVKRNREAHAELGNLEETVTPNREAHAQLGKHKETVKPNRKSHERLGKHKEKVKPNIKKRDTRPLFTMLKKELDQRFDSISQRVESFSPIKKGFCGKHTRFVSSSSSEEAEPRNESSSENDSDYSEEVFSPKSGVNSERGSSCPYPSVNEEMTRLGLKAETTAKPLSASDKQKQCKSSRSSKRKRQPRENLSNSSTRPSKLRKINSSGLSVGSEKKASINFKEEFQLSDSSLKLFVGIWKERCQGVNVLEALKRMLRFYKTRDRRGTWKMYTTYPFIGILHVAFSSITLGLWDSIYDTVQDVGQSNVSKPLISDACEYENIDVEPTSKDALVLAGRIFDRTNVEDIIKKLAEYLKHTPKDSRNDMTKGRFSVLKELSNCENWLVDQFCVKEFRALGHGDFLPFMEKHASLLPHELCDFLTCNASQDKDSPLEVCMMHRQLVTLLSQASHNIWANRKITEQDILSLLTKQFPLISFKVVTNGSIKDFLSAAVKGRNSLSPKSVIFSLTLCKTPDTSESSVSSKSLLENSSVKFDSDPDIQSREIVTSKDAINVLLKAPMLSDMNLWSHWDLRFAPSLGPLVPWLLKEVKTDEILCLVTKNGKVVRIDPSASADSFLEAAIQGSSFETAVQLLSLFSIVGGQEHISASLLKCHAQHAFKVISENSLEDGESNNCDNSLFNREMLQKNSTVARFILDCLLYMPSETRAFGADVFLHAMQAVVKNAASAILCECSQIDQRLMLHELGFSLGVVEWIDDFHAFCLKGESNLGTYEEATQNPTDNTHRHDVSKNFSTSKGSTKVSVSEDIKTGSSLGEVMSNVRVSDNRISGEEDADLVVESIRRDEFGLSPSLSSVESGLLKKQHARLGRALHCLSQELYSQDSHFILELVQNADDNNYPENVEPTLTFILQDSGIIVLNNERGFTARNIRALCDIGSSTKKGSNSGYIGQKGIGFKSVFRITDAPEIHSNGFHVKFDISEGQIGFVLPTVIPPCDLKLFSRLASSDFDRVGFNDWNTCIVLPFKSKPSEGNAMRSVMSMFSDLHPSLLLFLHRLECIKFRNLLEDSVVVMRKEIVGDGIVNVSYGEEKMTWFVVSQKIRSKFIRPDVDSTEISIAFTLQESSDGVYSPLLSQQPVFAFLPLRTYGLKFILQGNFALPSSREEVDGSSPWNQWLLSEFPGLFVQAEKSFCDLPCFKDFPGKAVSAFMSFVPLSGEVHGFFSSLPRMIISKLRSSKCLLLEGENREFVPPCKVLRGWSEEARSILPHGLLHEHLGLGFLDKNVTLSDSLARALGIEEYGPKVLVQFIASLSRQKSGLKSMGFRWLSSSLTELYSMMEHFPGKTVYDSEMETDIVNSLRRIPFIPLSNGSLSSVDEGTIWIQSDSSSSGSDNEHRIESFPCIYAKLRIVNPVLLSDDGSSYRDLIVSDKLTLMLHKIGVQRLSAHEIIRVHILPAISDENSLKDRNLMIEYVCFVMSHLNSSCHDCHIEREFIMSELQNKAYVLTNSGFKRPAEDSVHFSTEFGNPIDTTKLFASGDIRWHEVDSAYLKHPITQSLPSGLTKWREFFQGIGFTDFVKVIQVEKTLASISHTQLKNPVPDSISLGSMVKDWESPELVKLVSLFSRDGNIKSCEYLLEVLDKLWDSCFSDKTGALWSAESMVGCKLFTSSFISTISDTQWVVSSMDDRLHYPRDLYYDCDAVRSVLGSSAPYAVPKVKNEKLVSEIGLKTKVTLEDVVAMLKIWSSKTPFMASTAQMSKLYTFVWTELSESKKLGDEFRSGCFIFVPYTSGSRHDDTVSGTFLSPHEVYWSDSTGAMDLMSLENGSESETLKLNPLNKTLCNIYPSLHDFFVKSCGVLENPSLSSYVQILLQLSTVALPSQAAKAVFQILMKWAEGLNPGSEEVAHIKESLTKVEFTVLPTKQDKWVSLHPSFGLTCWCDDKKLKKQFKHVDGVDFLYFGNLNRGEKEMFRTKVSVLMRNLGIPALSEVISREAIYHGLSDSTFKASLVNWVLPYAQRYLHTLHPDTYSKLKKSGFDTVVSLKIVVVEELFYKNVIKSCGSKSDKRVKCTTLLQDKILYTTRESDTHALFSELSRLFFNGNPELHMANFLHMITTMAESGSNKDQTEFFILNSQKIPGLPDEESVWSLPSVSWSSETLPSETIKKKSSSISKEKPPESSNWPPVDWKTAPGFGYALEQGFESQFTQHIHGYENVDGTYGASQLSIEGDWKSQNDAGATSLETPEKQCRTSDEPSPERSREINPDPKLSREINPIPNRLARFQHYKSDLIRIGQCNDRGILTGRKGEQFAFQYFAELAGHSAVKWVNKDTETGLPYDLEINCGDGLREYVEVKTTVSANKNWVMISAREWAFANEKRDAFSIAHVVLTNENAAKIAIVKNPARLLEKRAIQLLVVMPPEQKYTSLGA